MSSTTATRRAMSSAAYEGPGKTGQIMIWADGAPKQIGCTWGLKPVEASGKPVSLLRWEGREISNPCLIIANDFGLRVDGRFKYRASLITDAPFFCLAGTWRPATSDWPAAYAALTTEAYPDIAPYKDRHVAVVREEDWLNWLQLSKPVSEILRPFPPGSFSVSGTGKVAAVGDLFDFS
ncbi:SOS response-associated peptidase [Sphingomonas sp. LY54]|uniref:SOS response-associated peptidase n=1 Tax=Sphingomonas sp. LY54 TaxID=3095343 RepID=UPI002D78D6D5|nr:SOS response-associated peptidase [Sphingomonas sp. LY54]WRP28717.1 SOS response-associated peptidase [Sphingomonas sp. LY54]